MYNKIALQLDQHMPCVRAYVRNKRNMKLEHHILRGLNSRCPY